MTTLRLPTTAATTDQPPQRRGSAKHGNGEGSIRKRPDGRWEARLNLPDGKRRSFYAATRQEVARRLAEASRDRDKGLPVVGERLTVGQFLADWLETKRGTLGSPRTWDRYEEYVRLHLMPTLGSVRLAHLTPQHVQRLYAAKREAGLAPTTIRHLHTVLHGALESALRQGLVQRNVCSLVDKPKQRRRQMTTWMPTQARAFLAAANGDRLEALYTLALSTGMRQAELFGLRWQDVDLEKAALSVTTTVQRSRSAGLLIKEPKTATSRRRIALATGEQFSVVEALRSHRTRQLEERLAAGPTWREQGLVFSDACGGPLRGSNVQRRSFAPLMRAAGVPQIRFHDLRHTAATLLLGQGVHPKIVSEMLGHASVAITLDLYSHVQPDMQRQAAAAMGAALGG